MQPLVIFCTCPDQKTADNITNLLLEKRLAACVNKVATTAHFIWQGSVDEANEILLVIKSSEVHFAELEKEIVAQHPYSVPEIIALPIVKGNQEYLQWMQQSLG